MAHAYHDELGVPTVTVRPFNVYGPGQVGGGAIRAFIERALAGDDLTIHGDGSQIRAWCYVDDMVEAVLLCLERPEAVGQSFNIGNARSAVTIVDLAQRIKRLTGCPGEIVFTPLDYADVELRIPNVEKAREQLGFEAKVELDEGLERTIAWYRTRKPALTRSPARAARRGRGRAGGDRGRARDRPADDGAEGGGVRGGCSPPPPARRTRWRSPPGRRRCTSRCSRSGSARATRCSCPRTRSRRPRTSSRSRARARCSSTSTRRR